MKAGDGGDSPSIDDVRKFVQTPEFVESYRKSVERVRLARASMIDRALSVLGERQNTLYRKMLGEPFDVGGMSGPGDEAETLTNRVAASLGLMGQRADPKFDVKVANPAYVATHPSVLIDERISISIPPAAATSHLPRSLPTMAIALPPTVLDSPTRS